MSILQQLYRDIARIDRVKPVNLRIVVNTGGKLHPFVEHGRLQAFARRNGRRLQYVNNDPKRPVFTLKKGYDHAVS